MKTTHPVSVDSCKCISLGKLVDNTIRKYTAVSAHHHNCLVNEIGDTVVITADEYAIDAVINGVLKAFIHHSRESRINISARQLYGKMIEINVKDDHCRNTYAMALSLQDIVPLAEQIGGQIDIINRKQTITTVSLRFALS